MIFFTSNAVGSPRRISYFVQEGGNHTFEYLISEALLLLWDIRWRLKGCPGSGLVGYYWHCVLDLAMFGVLWRR